MSTRRHQARLDELARQIATLDEALVDHERDAMDLAGDEEWCAAAQEIATRTRSDLERALREYFILAEFLRRREAKRFEVAA